MPIPFRAVRSSRVAFAALVAAAEAARASSDARLVDQERRAPTDRVEVRLARADGDSVDRSVGVHPLSPGRHKLELACVTHRPGGMAEFTEITTTPLEVELAEGATYVLRGVMDAQGLCSVTIEADAAATSGTDR